MGSTAKVRFPEGAESMEVDDGGTVNVNDGGAIDVNDGGALTVESGGEATVESGGTLNVEGVFCLGNDLYWLRGDDAPTDGTEGTGAGVAGPGSTYIDYTNAKEYINTGTKASPVWVVKGEQTS